MNRGEDTKMGKFVLLAILLTLLILIKPAIATGKALLLVSQNFPQIPFKPLHIMTPEPKHQTEELSVEGEKVIIDVFLPTSKGRHPAIILAMGVKTEDKDKKLILDFSETLTRLGFVVMWPRLDKLATDEKMIEDPSTFVEAFTYLERRDEVDKKRISFVGFSVGSSLALVAAESPTINEKVHGFVFFGGYYNIIDYLKALAEETISVEGKNVAWQPAEGAVSHAEKVLKKEIGLELSQFQNQPPKNIELLLNYSPDRKLENVKARIFILHDQDDPYVPFIESIKLKNALADQRIETNFHLSNLFEHAQVSGEKFSPKLLGEFVGLFSFLYKVLIYL